MQKYKNIIINSSILIITLIISIAVLELASSALYEKVAPKKGKDAVDILLNGRKTDFRGKTAATEVEVLPYYLYRNKPFFTDENGQQINSEGYRNGKREFGKKEKGKVRILAIGGSTTYGWRIKNYQDSWPLKLEKILNNKFNGKVEVINAGLPAGMSTESLVAFMLRDKHLEPDIVIFHNGGNDLSPLMYEDYYPDYRYYRSSSESLKLRPGEGKLINNSNFIKLLYAFWLNNADLSSLRMQPKVKSTSMELEVALKNVQNNYPIGFERNMDSMISQTIDIGAVPVIFPFHLATKDVYNLIPKNWRYTEKIYDAMSAGLNRNKDSLKILAKKYNIGYYEMSQNQVPLEYFLDHCHLNSKGDMVKAEFIAKHITSTVKTILRQ